MRATAQRSDDGSYRHSVSIRDHRLTVDEPRDSGGDDAGPTPQELLAASLASCVAITMEMYAARKGWDLGEVAVSVQYSPPERGCPTHFTVELALPAGCTEEQQERLRVIAAKCPVHRILEGEVSFEANLTVLG